MLQVSYFYQRTPLYAWRANSVSLPCGLAHIPVCPRRDFQVGVHLCKSQNKFFILKCWDYSIPDGRLSVRFQISHLVSCYIKYVKPTKVSSSADSGRHLQQPPSWLRMRKVRFCQPLRRLHIWSFHSISGVEEGLSSGQTETFMSLSQSVVDLIYFSYSNLFLISYKTKEVNTIRIIQLKLSY